MKSIFRKLSKAIGSNVASSLDSGDEFPAPTRDLEARRRTSLEGADWLQSNPLDAGGIERIELLRSLAPGLMGAVVHRPVLTDGRTSMPEDWIFAVPPALERIAPDESAAPADPRVGFEHDGTITRAQIRFPLGTSIYGTGEVAGPLLRSGRTTIYWNIDAWRYGEETPSLYQSHPFALAVLPDGKATGVFAHALTRGGLIAARDGLEFHFEGEPFDVWTIDGDHPKAVLSAFTALIGRMPLPPLWSLGYHQCRWSYMSADEIRGIAAEFRKRKIPCDTLWFDIDHQHRFRTFTWDPERFPDPEGLFLQLKKDGFRTVAIADPALEAADDFPMNAEGLRDDHFVRDARGRVWRGRCWPGVCHFPDFTRPETRDWWAAHAAIDAARGLDGFWNDMNEPAVFRIPSRTMPDDLVHRGFGGGSHTRFHNVYGRLMVEATHEGLVRANPDRRPFVLTRSGFLGIARFAAVWTGDNQARFEDLAWTIPMVLNLGMVGVGFSGPDLGGYDGDPSPELYVRWFEIGAFLPFCRGHAEKGSCRKEPWAFGGETEAMVRGILERRMRFLPYLYTVFREAAETGWPVVRPLFFSDPADPALRAIGDAFTLGDQLAVLPVVRAGARERSIYLPNGRWYEFSTGRIVDGGGRGRIPAPLGETPIFVKEGSIIVCGPVRMTTAETPDLPWTVHVFLDRDGRAEGRLYEDAGDGFGHERGEFSDRRYLAVAEKNRVRITWSRTGSLFPADRRIIVLVHGAPRVDHVLRFEGKDAADLVVASS